MLVGHTLSKYPSWIFFKLSQRHTPSCEHHQKKLKVSRFSLLSDTLNTHTHSSSPLIDAARSCSLPKRGHFSLSLSSQQHRHAPLVRLMTDFPPSPSQTIVLCSGNVTAKSMTSQGTSEPKHAWTLQLPQQSVTIVVGAYFLVDRHLLAVE